MLESESVAKRKSSGSGVHSNNAALPWWLSTAVALGALLMASGGIIALVDPAMLVAPHEDINGAVHIYAGYLASRNLVVAAMLLAALGLRARAALSTLMVLTAFIQVVDAVIDFSEGRWAIVPGVLIFGLIFLIGAARLSGSPFWSIAAWRREPVWIGSQHVPEYPTTKS